MIRKISYLILLSLLMAAFLAMTASASKERIDRRVIDPNINKSLYYSFPDEHQRPEGMDGSSTAPLGGFKSSSFTDSPGLVIGHTWYDYQRNGSMDRMIGWGEHDETGPVRHVFAVHFGWMRLMPPIGANRHYAYQAWVDQSDNPGQLLYAGDGSSVQSPGDWSGYVRLDVDNSNRAIIGGHWDAGGLDHFTSAFWFDRVPVSGFYFSTFVPDAQQEYVGPGPACADQEVIWPAFSYQEGTGGVNFDDTVLHVFACVSDVDSPCVTAVQALYYFRKVGARNFPGQVGGIPGVWDFPPRIVDTVSTLSEDVFASNQSGKVVIAWHAPRPNPGACDTCSGTGTSSLGNSQLDSDLYYQISNDQGATWNPRINLTLRYHPDSGQVATYWTYIDLNLLLDEDDDELHITWNGRYYEPGGQIGLFSCRLFHWSETLGFLAPVLDPDGDTRMNVGGVGRGRIRTAHDAVWDQTECNGGSWQMNLSKMTMTQCNGKHYILFVMFNDIPNGIEDDCAARAFTGGGGGAANGELWMVVSEDNGVTWDKARNLTKSYSGPTGNPEGGCQPPGGTADPCESDHWPSSTPYGTDYLGEFPANLVVADGGADDGWAFDVQYINDPDAGGIPQDEGTWQQADVKWIRVACVEPIPAPNPIYSFNRIDFPSCEKHGIADVRNLTIENAGNVTWNYTVAKFETAGPAGWLTFATFDGSILSGLNNVETGTVTLNTGGIVNTPGTIVNLRGGLVFTSIPGSFGTDTIPISHWVADTCVPPTPDTISNSVFSLVVFSNGKFGNNGDGGVNLDFVYADSSGPDCDTNANVSLYDGTPFIMQVLGTDTSAHWSMFQDGWLSENGFRPRVGKHHFESYLYECYSTGIFSTNDSGIFLEKTWYSPRNYGNNGYGFFVQCVKMWSANGLAHNNLTIGEMVDWDMMSDSGVDNASGFTYTAPGGGNPAFNLIYQQGANYDDGDTTECQDNSLRYGGVLALGTFKNGAIQASGNIVNAFTIDNVTYVEDGVFSPQQIYNKIDSISGFQLFTSGDPDSEFVDLSMIVTNLHEYNLGATDTLTMYYVFSSTINGNAEFTDWINKGRAFDKARVCYANWAYPTEITYQATSVIVAGNQSAGTASGQGSTASYSGVTNATTITGSGGITHWRAPSGGELVVTRVLSGANPVAFHQVRWLSAETPSNLNGKDTLVFEHQGEGLGAAKVATFSWFSAASPKGNLFVGGGFTNPASVAGVTAFATFIQTTTNLGNYTGWSQSVPAGMDEGVPRTINQTIVGKAAVNNKWLYVKAGTDGGVGPYLDGAQIDGFQFGCCVQRGNINSTGPIDIADLTYLVKYMFASGPPPPCLDHANVNNSGPIDIADLTYLVKYMFASGPAPIPC